MSGHRFTPNDGRIELVGKATPGASASKSSTKTGTGKDEVRSERTKATAQKKEGGASNNKAEIVKFGLEVRLARVRAGTFQRAIADYMGWHPTAVSQLERGDREWMPDLRTVQQLDDFLEAGGHLVEAAGYTVAKSRKKVPDVQQTITLPLGLTKRDRDKINAYIDLLVHDKRRD
jgi:transcriptional regulator with XRE-family HTH domain